MLVKLRTIMTALAIIGLMCGVVYASGGGEHSAVDGGVLLKDFLYRILNFAIVVAILVYFLRKPLKKGLAGRKEEIEKTLAAAKKAQQEAEAKFAEYDRKLTQAAEEIEALTDSIRREGELEKQKIIANAEEMAGKIEADAGKAADFEIEKAKTALRREAVQLAVEIAEDVLKTNFTKDDDTRLIDEYMQKVGELH